MPDMTPDEEMRKALRRDIDSVITLSGKNGERPDLYAIMNLIDIYVTADRHALLGRLKAQAVWRLEDMGDDSFKHVQAVPLTIIEQEEKR